MGDASSASSWTYDARGRVSTETKVINGTGGGTFKTQWGYNSADLVIWMKYPANATSGLGEEVRYTYLSQMALDTVKSQTYNYYYVQQTQYDAAGRIDLRKLGAANLAANPLLVNDYSYNAWTNQGGRLQTLGDGYFGPIWYDLISNAGSLK